ncbi:hypothetical protein [Kordia sp.]|uniref:hypothetical protein n=1 Tax=Kordia sp. TaxID=1965332 RepID=UPI003B59320C
MREKRKVLGLRKFVVANLNTRHLFGGTGTTRGTTDTTTVGAPSVACETGEADNADCETRTFPKSHPQNPCDPLQVNTTNNQPGFPSQGATC